MRANLLLAVPVLSLVLVINFFICRDRVSIFKLFHRTEERSSKLRQTSTHRLLSQIDDELDDLLGVALQAPIGAPSLDLSTPQDLQAIQFQEVNSLCPSPKPGPRIPEYHSAIHSLL